MVYDWKVKPSSDEGLLSNLSKDLNINKHLCHLLAQRGIRSYDEAKRFFRPSLNELYDPYLLSGMDIAVKRILKAISSKEKILVYGDYDVDGTTSVAMMYRFLSTLLDDILYYIPDRYKEGYGVSEEGIRFAKSADVSLILTIDCGIRAVDKVELASSLGIDVIICDHHEQGEQLPRAVAILNPKKRGDTYPFKGLSGCGVAFKLIQAVSKELYITEDVVNSFLDFVAISIAADIVPVVDENRILLYHGLKQINSSPSDGIRSLLYAAAEGDITERSYKVRDIVFGVAPMINAAGRIGHAHDAVELFTTKNPIRRIELAKKAHEKNETRKSLDRAITAEALDIINSSQKLQKASSTVLYNPEWSKGVIGIVASRCIETYYRPTIIFTQSNEDEATGSARSVAGYSVYDAINSCGHLLTKYGGHKYAAGLSLKLENLEKFTAEFEKIVSATINPDLLIPKINIDGELPFEFINYNIYNIIEQMAPFGPENMSPVFFCQKVSVVSYKILKDKHLKLTLRHNSSTQTFNAIAFNMAEKEALLKPGTINISFSIEENCYLGRCKLQLKIKDIRKQH